MESRVGSNIRSLRKAYGETQEELGSIVNVEKNTISYYESGKREPDREILAAIAKHYGVSTEELIVDDFSGIGKIEADYKIIWQNIDLIFPLVSSDKAMQDVHFSKAYTLHRKIFDELRKLDFAQFNNLRICGDGYELAFENEVAEDESLINYLGILYLLLLVFKAAPRIEKTFAPIRWVEKSNPVLKRELENGFGKEKLDLKIEKKFDCDVASELAMEIISVIKQSEEWQQLADYYLALCFLYGLRENGLSVEFNRRIGIEMVYAFAELGNVYAERYIRLIVESSQIVDDKKNRK